MQHFWGSLGLIIKVKQKNISEKYISQKDKLNAVKKKSILLNIPKTNIDMELGIISAK